jgi:hypothetical protein
MTLISVQTPPTASLSQSPLAYSYFEDSNLITSQSFQYMLDLYFWTGSQSNSGSVPDYTLVKYPNESGRGIFDVSRILNAELNEYAIINNVRNTKWFTADGYFQYLDDNVFVTGSKIRDRVHLAIDGYSLFPENISNQLHQKTEFFPSLTDGPQQQYAFREQTILRTPVYVSDSGNGKIPRFEKVTLSFSSGSDAILQGTGTFPLGTIASGSNNQQIYYAQRRPTDFSLESYPIIYWIEWQFLDQDSVAMGSPIRYNIVPEQKYPNIQIMWKNRYGVFDFFNFNMVNTKNFEVNRSQYQPQIGSWNSNILDYKPYENSVVNYLVDTNESIVVNTDWVNEEYNEVFKQLLVSDEIYWIIRPDLYAINGSDSSGLKPITIKTNNLQFKTGVVDKLIQYTFEFDFGQSYKLIL